MSWRFACVVAACLVGLCLLTSLGGVDATELAKKHSQKPAVPLPYFPFQANMNPMAKMGFMMPQMPMPQAPMPRFADAHLGAHAKEPLGESNSQADDTDRDFVRSIYNLLSRSRDANVADNSVLERQRQETEKKQQELNRKAEILKSRAAMLTRLQYCLEKDASTEGKVLPRPPTPPQASTGPTAAQRDLAKKLADLESQLALRKKELDDMAKDLANRENNLNQRVQDIQGQEKKIIQLKNDANICNCPPSPAIPPNNTIPLPEPEKCPPPPQCSHRDDDFPKIEKCVGPVVGHSRPQHVRCWKQCNRNPACFRQCLLSASKTVGNLDRFRSRRDDTAKDSETDEEEEVAPRLVVEPAAPTEPLAAVAPAAPLAPAAAVVSNKMRFAAQKAQAAVSQKQRNPWLAADSKLGTCPGRCDLYQRCDLCAADPNCGWCSSSQRCFDVNEGKSKCAEADYSIMYCREQTCSQHRFCSSCMSDPKCGMCHSTGRCMKGGITGPADGTCNNWSYASGLRFLSLNIYGRDMSNCTARGNVIFQMLEHANADFVALQEVEDWFLELLSRQKWAANYHMSDFGSGHAPGGLLILSKVPLASVAYYERTMPGQVEVDQRGRMLVVHPKMGNNRFAFATTTLDWRGADSRADSMEFLFSVLNTTRDVVLAGDFNFDQNAQPETGQIPFNYEDVWQSLRPQHVGYTWDPATNSYAHNSDPNSRPSRIDRLLVKAGFWEARKIQKIGSPLASPHYGLLAQLELFGAYC